MQHTLWGYGRAGPELLAIPVQDAGYGSGMLYDAYQAQQDLFAPMRAGADLVRAAFSDTSLGPAANYLFRCIAAGAEIISRAHLIHERPDYGITSVNVAGRPVAGHRGGGTGHAVRQFGAFSQG